MDPHPLDPLSSLEISRAATLVRGAFPSQDLRFRFITLREPLKEELLPFLEREHRNEDLSNSPPRVARVQINRSLGGRNKLHELLIDLDKETVISQQYLEGKHSYIDSAYMQEVEKVCREDSKVQAEIDSLQLPSGAHVVVEAWAYATDGQNDMSERTTMCWFYMRLADNPDANYYAYPLDICAEVSEQLRVTNVYRLPLATDDTVHNDQTPFDIRHQQDPAHSEYHPTLRPPPRTTTKPLHIHQPEGVSFKTQRNLLTWEKWRLRIGFNYREGLTLHDICYDGCSLFFRLSLAEMFVPYGDPRPPYPRKGAFDLGNDGAGVNANDLRLGCDCLGVIKYYDAWHNTSSGEPLKLPNVICCHEQDDGILWKHTNFRTQNAVVARSRILVLQTIITVSNYEYIFAFHFGQDASIHYEVRATGILSTVPISLNTRVPYGTIVAPGVLAPYHQHLFCLRIDPHLSGRNNTLQIQETHPLPPDPITNPAAIGYTTTTTLPPDESAHDLSIPLHRTFTIINESHLNPTTHTPIGYALVPHPSPLLLAHPTSYHARRAEFALHALWITRFADDELYPAGRHTMQSLGGDGIASWIARRRDDPTARTGVRDADIVLWHTFGTTHNPRIEDWPVMPSEKMTVGLKPVNFFAGNPAIDVAVSGQGGGDQSVLVSGE